MRSGRMRMSTNVQDRRGMGAGRGLMIGGGGLGTIVLVILYFVLGGNPSTLVQTGTVPTGSGAPASPAEAEAAERVGRVLGDTEDVWAALFREQGRTYQPPTLVLFTGAVDSACGTASSAVGPFYCPLDSNVYIDLAFYDDLHRRFGAPGDFAQAYVIAHEVGHHVQHLLGTAAQVREDQRGASKAQANDLSVRLELQADFYAGVWAHYAMKRGLLEAGDVEEGLTAAAAVGDDRVQHASRGHVTPDSFTHGTAAQRARWFRKGLETGDPKAGDTFTGTP